MFDILYDMKKLSCFDYHKLANVENARKKKQMYRILKEPPSYKRQFKVVKIFPYCQNR